MNKQKTCPMGDVPWGKNYQNSDMYAICLFAKLSSWIIGPVLIAIFTGKWLDEKYNTEPWLFLTSVGTSFIISMTGLTRNSIKEMKKINDKSK